VHHLGLAGIEQHAREWDALAQASRFSPTADATWMRCFWSAFGDDDRALQIKLLYAGDRLAAVVPVRRTGRLLRTCRSVVNAHAPYWTFALDEQCTEAPGQILDHLLASNDVLVFGPMHCDDRLWDALVSAASARRYAYAREDCDGDLFIDVQSSPDKMLESIPAKMRRETGRKMRQLERLGHLRYEAVTGGSGLMDTLEACLDLELKGWKGVRGTPIRSDPRTYQFYTELCKETAWRNRFALYLLWLDGKLIAYEYSLRAQAKIDMLKPSYDPELSRFSPGNVLRYKVLVDEAEKGEIQTYHLGRPAEWKYQWARQVRPLARLRIYGPSFKSQFGYLTGPALRQSLKRSSGLRRTVGWARRRGWMR
jgi:CelD/BcsL family acetyltransferase involved in cellulose biosynthesis